MSHENWLITGLSLTVAVLLSLIAALTYQMSWSNLAIVTLLFGISYPLIWLAWRCYRFWQQAIMQLTSYSQILNEGEYNLHFKKQHKDNLLYELQKEIYDLAINHSDKKKQNQTLDNILSHILDAWPIPVCLFDHQMKLIYRNNAMNEQLKQPMLIGSSASDLGFRELGIREKGISEKGSQLSAKISHPDFNEKWQCQSISYLQNGNQHK